MKKSMSREYIKPFDGLRVLALLAVLFYHLMPSVFKGGYLGVVIFFVMAGYLSFEEAVYKRGASKSRTKLVLESILKKFKKLYPPLLLMMFVVVLVMLAFFRGELGANAGDIRSSVLSFNNYFQIFSGKSYFDSVGILSPFTHIWALSLEFQFYVLFFIFFYGRYDSKNKGKWLVNLIVITLLSYALSVGMMLYGVEVSKIYYGLFTRLYSFSLGAIASIISNRRLKDSSRINDVTIAIFSLLVIVSVFVMGVSDFAFYGGFFIFSLLMAIFLMFLRVADGKMAGLFSNIVFVGMARRSYHIYLWHFPIIKIAEKALAHSGVGRFAFVLICLVLTVIFSELSYIICNKLLKVGRRSKGQDLFILILFILLLALPYKTIASTSTERKELDEMKAIIEANEKEQEAIREAEKTASEVVTTTSADTSEKDSSNQAEDKTSTESSATQTTTAEEEVKIPENDLVYDNAVGFIDWVNANVPEASMDVMDYTKYRDVSMIVIGDSISSMSYHTMFTYMPDATYDTLKSRQFKDAYETWTTNDYGSGDYDYVFLQLGTNGPVNPEDIDKVYKELNGKKLILASIVLPYIDEETERNKEIYAYAKSHDDVYLVDWYAVAKDKPDLFFPDNIHPGELGARVYSQLIMNKVIEIEKN